MKQSLLLLLVAITSSLYAQNALDFDGLNDNVQTTLPSISGNSARTIEAWIKTTANANPSANGSQKVIADMGTGATGSRFTFNILWANAIRLEVAGSGLSGSVAVNDGLWHHVAVVYDPMATNTISLYVDGVLDVAGNIATPVNTSAAGDFRIGRRIDNVNNFDGSIDEVRVWNVARSAVQIANDRNTEYCQVPSGLIAYYQFNQGDAGSNNSGKNKLIDAVGANTGTLDGFSLNGNSSNWVNGASIAAGLAASLSNLSTCDSIAKPSNPLSYWTSSGIQRDTLPNNASCDSLIFVNLTVNKSRFTATNDSVCEPYISPSGNYTYTTSGIYYDTTLTGKGCPDYHTLDLQININDTTVSLNGLELTANEANAQHYIWLDCTDDFSQISGSNNRVFTPTQDGEYAVRITNGKCIDTSECFTIKGVGLGDLKTLQKSVVYPNPVYDNLTVAFEAAMKQVRLKLINAAAQEMLSREYTNVNEIDIDVIHLPAGLYLLQLDAGNEQWQQRIIKK